MSDVACPHCGVRISSERAASGWCEECGKKLPSSLLPAPAATPRVLPARPCQVCGQEADDLRPGYLAINRITYLVVAAWGTTVHVPCATCPRCYSRIRWVLWLRILLVLLWLAWPILVRGGVGVAVKELYYPGAVMPEPLIQGVFLGGGVPVLLGPLIVPFVSGWLTARRLNDALPPELSLKMGRTTRIVIRRPARAYSARPRWPAGVARTRA